MELKEIVKNHLVEEKETARLERVKANKNLREITVFTSDQVKMCESYIKTLKDEGIKFKEIKVQGNEKKWEEIVYLTNMPSFPTIVLDDNYLLFQRDFQNPQQLIALLQYYAKPSLKGKINDIRIFESLKTQTYHLHTRLNNIEKKLNPIMNFLTDLKNQLTEESE